MASTTMQTATFLRIPLELRLQIYEYLLLLPRTPRHLGRRRTPDARIHAAILSVCAQTHEEATPVLYGANVFLAHPSLLTTMPRLRPWHAPVVMPSTPPPNDDAPLFRHPRGIRRWWVRIRLDVAPAWTADAVEAAFDGADEVVLEAWQSVFLGAGVDALRRFEGVRGVRRVRVFGSLAGLEGYVRWLKRAMMAPPGAVVPGYVASDEAEQKRLTGWSGDAVAFTAKALVQGPRLETKVYVESMGGRVMMDSESQALAGLELSPEDLATEAKTVGANRSRDFAANFSEIATVLMG